MSGPRTHLARSGLGLALAAACALGACRGTPDLEAEPPWPRPRRGMVVCEHPLAARIGAQVLDDGGNAVDAGIAAAIALAVVYPQAGNLGGGGFALYVPHSGEPVALDFRETAPAGAKPENYLDAQAKPKLELAREGALSVGVPGSPAGWLALHQRLGSGKFSLYELAKPAIEIARGGYAVDEALARDLAKPETRERLTRCAATRERFYPRGEPLRAGETLLQPDLASTLAQLTRVGRDSFYSGATARRVADELANAAREQGLAAPADGTAPGWITTADLASYQVKWRVPLRGWFRGSEVITMPPPSSGGIILLQALSVLDGFPLDLELAESLSQPALTEIDGAHEAAGLDDRIVHWWIEVLRSSFAERAERMGDPDFRPVPVDELLSPQWIAKTRISIGELASATPAREPLREGSETTQISVLDEHGNALSLTTTLNSFFGNGRLVPGAGFFLNNELDDFSLSGGVPNQFGLVGGAMNAIEPGKRPLSSMTPTVIRDGGHTVSMVLGSPGGPRIITAVIGVVLRTLVLGQSLADAVRAPRFHQQWSPGATEFEPGWPAPLLDGLRRRGHEIRVMDERWASVQAIRVTAERDVEGASDPRRNGAAVSAND